jgi:transcriptional regulator GlxA family with amidase domain
MICIAWLGDASGWPAVIDDTHGRLQTLANWLMDYLPVRDPADWHRADTVMAAVALECAGQVRQRVDPGIREVQRHVRDNLAQPHSLASLAQIAGMSPFHFAREFKAQTGQTVMGFVRRTRVEVARGYLLSSQLPLKAIASRVGFADAFQLSRVYRKVAGYPPGQERRSTRHN